MKSRRDFSADDFLEENEERPTDFKGKYPEFVSKFNKSSSSMISDSVFLLSKL